MRVPGAAALAVVALIVAGCVGDEDVTTSASRATTSSPPVAHVMVPATTNPDWADAHWRDTPCDGPPLNSTTPLPDLVALESRGAITHYAWNANGTLRPVAQQIPGTRFAAVAGSTVLTADKDANGWHLAARRPDLTAMRSIDVPQVTAMHAAAGTLYVATMWNLTAYDTDLHQLGRLDLQVPGLDAVKDSVTDIEVVGGYAHLNMVFRDLRIDVRDPAAMRVELVYQISARQVPRMQWLNRTSQTWFVEQNTLGAGYVAASVVPLHLANGTAGKDVTVWVEGFDLRVHGYEKRNASGAPVSASTFTLPAWAITGRGNLSLSRLDITESAVVRSCLVPTQDLRLLQRGDLLVTYASNHVTVWDTPGRLRVRQEAFLPQAPGGLVLLPV